MLNPFEGMKPLIKKAMFKNNIEDMRDVLLFMYELACADIPHVTVETVHGTERLTRDEYDRVKREIFADHGGKIQAIKWLRSVRYDHTTQVGMGLKEAKDIVDRIAELEGYDPYR